MGISDDILKQIQDALQAGIDPQSLKESARELADSIKKRTRLGKGVAKDGENLRKLKDLQTSYKAQRRSLKRGGKLSGDTTPAKSNLTKSGEMLDSIDSKITSTGFEIIIKGEENQEKAKYVQKDRPFMYIASFELKVLIKGIIDRIRRFK